MRKNRSRKESIWLKLNDSKVLISSGGALFQLIPYYIMYIMRIEKYSFSLEERVAVKCSTPPVVVDGVLLPFGLLCLSLLLDN